MTKLLYADLTYTMRSALMDVHNALGPGLPEQFYDDAASIAFQETGLACERQKVFDIFYRDVLVGRHIPDATFLNDKVILDYKVAPEITPLHKAQMISYLKVTDADLGLLANFGEARLKVERLPNFLRERQPTNLEWQTRPLPEDALYPELTAKLFEYLHRVHFALGPGFIHRVYRRATMTEFAHADLSYRHIKELPISYHSHHLGTVSCQLIVIENKIAVATVALQESDEAAAMALRARLRQLDLKLGLLANFYNTRLAIHPVRVAEPEEKPT